MVEISVRGLSPDQGLYRRDPSVGIDNNVCEVVSWDIKVFFYYSLVYLPTKTKFRVINVYDSPYGEGKDDFLSKLHALLYLAN